MFYGEIKEKKNASSKGYVQLKPKRRNVEQELAYILTDVKETVVTENFYQPIPLNILKLYMPKGMF